MTTTLAAIGFRDQTTASAAAQHVSRLSPDIILDADAIAVMSRDDDGVVQVTTRHQAISQMSSTSLHGVFWLPLFTALCLAPMLQMPVGGEWLTLQGKIEATGLVDAFRQPISNMLQPGTSILFLAIGPTIPIDAVTDLQRHFGGTVVKAQLTRKQLLEVHRAFHRQSETGAND